ncbi:peptide ABC transporter ATP-binding protein [Acuticoccus sediminis]|uniref:Peptide ABC transporter ATP-binding protein n=1 Tax=Acuticoccus sediminis TaxID=2184697 RepID=A0A8B2NQU2_9HYPH|nr:ABC transporter ATP-binding protein [Acuticoccus sediminis]RAH97369.1 peptide ABC transporter ATP-binding protein [Acuticoccus sediminis]
MTTTTTTGTLAPEGRGADKGRQPARTSLPEPMLDLVRIRKDFVLGGGLVGRITGTRRVFQALRDVSLSVRKGEIVSLVGESGSGKSTLAQVAVRLLDVDGGDVAYRGEGVTHRKGKALKPFREKVQMVFQDTGSSFNPRKTIGRALDETLRLRGVPRDRRQPLSVALLERVGLGDFVRKRYPHQLSGGQRQRAAIARSLAMNPEFLVADEPVASLDVSLQAQIVNLLIRLRDELGLTLLFISHDLALVSQISNRVAVMYAGRIVEEGPPDTVLKHPAHPYTRALIDAIPKGLDGRRRGLARRDGVKPDRSLPSAGCRFAPRCPLAMAICRDVEPASVTITQGHRTECHLVDEAKGYPPQQRPTR